MYFQKQKGLLYDFMKMKEHNINSKPKVLLIEERNIASLKFDISYTNFNYSQNTKDI